MKRYILLRRWEAMELQEAVNKHLETGWDLHGDTFTHMEERNHAVTGEPYKAPMFCQAMTNKPFDLNKIQAEVDEHQRERLAGMVVENDNG